MYLSTCIVLTVKKPAEAFYVAIVGVVYVGYPHLVYSPYLLVFYFAKSMDNNAIVYPPKDV